MKKKIISLCLVIALVATAIAGATLAYFTDVTEVNTNTFTVGDVDIKLDEAKVGDDGKAITGDGAERVIKNTYPNVYPNQTVDKDPTVSFVGENNRDCYVRMIVTLDNSALEKAFPATDSDFASYWQNGLFLLEKLVDGYYSDIWEVNADATKPGTYEFWYYKMVPAGTTALEPLFKTITFPADMTNEQIAALNGFEVDIVAHAIQADGFETAENPMAAAWAAWADSDPSNLATVPTEATEATEETTDLP